MAFSPTKFFELIILISQIVNLFILQSLFHFGFSVEIDTITRSLVIKDPNTISSRGNIFKLGFFSPDNTTKKRYLGIYYTFSESTVVWVANRGRPILDSSGRVTISGDGNIVAMNAKGEIFWSSNVTTSSVNNSAQLMDTGNFVLWEKSSGKIIWESFLHRCGVSLPTSKDIDNINIGYKALTSSWKTPTDPDVGSFTCGLQALNIPQSFIWNGSRPHWRNGFWNGLLSIGVKEAYSTVYVLPFKLVNDPPGTFSYFMTMPKGRFIRFELNSSGSLMEMFWNNQTQKWDITWLAPENECDIYGTCGPFGRCNAKSLPICSCLKGFEPKDSKEWGRGIWLGGCLRKKPLACQQNNITSSGSNEDGFLRLPFMKPPDFPEPVRPSSFVEECKNICLRNCSCIAYAYDTNLGCIFWSQDLIDLQQYSGAGLDLYIRLESSELGEKNAKKLVIVIIPVVAGSVVIFTSIFISWRFLISRKKVKSGAKGNAKYFDPEIDDLDTVILKESPFFSFKMLANATNQFHQYNMLGKGGFGPVYKGKLANGKEIAIKRLSAASRQGIDEFVNEMTVISKLQHRNLVKLLGCCVEKEEKILVYEYMQNNSLDVSLFDPLNPSQKLLDWKKRFNIIESVGRGLLYLHRDSLLKIIHRDLKPSNVLLDDGWNPKISDFGIARIFEVNQDKANTSRVIGTYGYMAPEYAVEGRFSEMSDIYSFGVLMLEILSGKRNINFFNHEWSLSLLGCAWKLWNEDNISAFIDKAIFKEEFKEEMMRCIHVALLCIQELPKDRPTISTVLAMLSWEIVDLPLPQQPTFAEKWNCSHATSSQMEAVSINDVTLTMLDGR